MPLDSKTLKSHARIESALASTALKSGVRVEHLTTALEHYRKHLTTVPDDQLASLKDDALHEHAGEFFTGMSEVLDKVAPPREPGDGPPEEDDEDEASASPSGSSTSASRTSSTAGASSSTSTANAAGWARPGAGASKATIKKRTGGLTW